MTSDAPDFKTKAKCPVSRVIAARASAEEAISGPGQSSGSKTPTLPMKRPPAIVSQAHMP
jgi:hypothetical protein